MQNIEEYCAQQNISHIDFLKLDVEGMEYEILESLSDEFLQKIQALLLECHFFSEEQRQKYKEIKIRLSSHYTTKTLANQYDDRLEYLFCQR